MVIYSDPPREKKAAPQPSEYEQAIDRLKKLRIDKGFVNFELKACGIQMNAKPGQGSSNFGYECLISWIGFGGERHQRIETRGTSPLDATCACIDQWRTALAREEEENERLRATIDKAVVKGVLFVEVGTQMISHTYWRAPIRDQDEDHKAYDRIERNPEQFRREYLGTFKAGETGRKIEIPPEGFPAVFESLSNAEERRIRARLGL